MNWEAIGAAGELIGSAAVFVTLVYLAAQVRHARAESSRALSQGRMEANREVLRLDMEEQNLATIIKAETSLGSPRPPLVVTLMEHCGLDLEEAWRMMLIEAARWNYRVHVITHVQDLSDIERAVFDDATRIRYGSSVTRLLYMNHFRAAAHPDVVKYVDNLLPKQ